MQGFNMGRYVPPEHEGVHSGNALNGKHALGARANKIGQGILTVRFEMPYAIWCTTCAKPTIIGQGVRFNAEKKKVGNYYSSPIYSFRMKHTACGGWIEIRTDPKNTAYVVVEGARKRDLGEDKVKDGDLQILSEAEREKLRSNAFAVLEGKNEDQERLQFAKRRLEDIQDLSEQRWEDPYSLNKHLRDSFRVERKQRERDAQAATSLQDKMSLAIDVLPAHEDDARRAALVEFETANEEDISLSKPLFAKPRTSSSTESRPKGKMLKSEQRTKQMTSAWAREVQGNTRKTLDPFLADVMTIKDSSKTLPRRGKRKRDVAEEGAQLAQSSAPLVNYDSD